MSGSPKGKWEEVSGEAVPYDEEQYGQGQEGDVLNDGYEVEGDYGEQGDEEYLEEQPDVAPVGLAPDHPLLADVQAGLAEQLMKDIEQAEATMRELKAKEAHLETQREEVGVELYGFQHRLAQVQIAYDDSADEYNTHRAERDALLLKSKAAQEEVGTVMLYTRIM
ncbi:hypothetical protein KIPB_008422 [Kipferlia bialata]|uniref:Uncharacterized protein n=1 Tax=Kipferlia bialata TaxID=797122 RepID=A0A9K3GKT2_9EUKA|nr:hypothetical protein KIPB_008422 [Kipferlia bialata]|eukprot:g8422.t1